MAEKKLKQAKRKDLAGAAAAEMAQHGEAAQHSPASLRTPWRVGLVAAAVVAAAVVVAAVWLVPRPIGDLYVALAGGRDVVEGKLGAPDEWSFMSVDPQTGANRVWINQNWGTHLAYFLAFEAAGGAGLLAVKALLLIGVVLAIAKAARQMRVSWEVALVVAALAVLASRSFVDLRPNLTTLLMAPLLLWLLLRSSDRVHRVWLAAAIVWLWANSHGGFVLGIGMMALYTLCQVVPALTQSPREAARKYWPLPAATLAATLLAGLANPFGLTNLTHPLVMYGPDGAVWRSVSEWRTIFDIGFGTVWEFSIFLGVLATLMLVRLVTELIRRRGPAPAGEELIAIVVFLTLASAAVLYVSADAPGDSPVAEYFKLYSCAAAIFAIILCVPVAMRIHRGQIATDWQRLGRLVFVSVLAVVVIYMAIQSRRFIPLAMIVSAPLLAAQFQWAINLLDRRLALLLAGGAVACSMPLYANVLSFHDAANPRQVEAGLFDRMHFNQSQYCPDIAEFINANNISGRMFTEWRWEGFMRWRCPQMKNFIGGRAQQAYDAPTYELGLRISGTSDVAGLESRGVSYVVVPVGGYGQLINALAQAGWAAICCDGDNLLLVDAKTPHGRKLAADSAAGKLRYPSREVELLSRSMQMAMSPQGQSAAALSLLEQALPMTTSRFAFEVYGSVLFRRLAALEGAPAEAVIRKAIALLEAQDRRLAALSQAPRVGVRALICRLNIQITLAALHERQGDDARTQRAHAAASNVEQELDEMHKRWD